MAADNKPPPGNEGPLSRWSRRKAETREKESAEKKLAAAPPLEEAPRNLPEVAGDGTRPEEAAPPDLPDIDSLDAESDFTVFMRDGVPDQMRKLALRKLWRSDPVLANLDGLLEYGEDYTDAADVVKNLQTAYQVGKGYATEEPEEPEDVETPEEEEAVEVAESDRPTTGEDGQETEDGDGEAIAEPGEKETGPSGGTG